MKLAIVGKGGAGKTTVISLLTRFYDLKSGSIRIDGTDIRRWDPRRLRRQVGVVLQDNCLFSRSVRENIALSDPGLPMAPISAAARLAGAHEFILELPEGYDTLIGEHGANLSGGQRQRIAIARALVTDPSILILDEASSALDYESELTIQRNMRSICKGRTVFIIAHRLSALRYADRILVMEAGRIAEQGHHEALLELGGRYARLHAMQKGLAAASVQHPRPSRPARAGAGTALGENA